jgi:universal stress protein A
MFSPKKILVPTDFSEFSDNAIADAVDIARQHKSTIHLLHVLSVVQQCLHDYCLAADALEDVRRKSFESAREMIQKQVEKVGKTDGVEIITDIREGAPIYEEILKEQKDINVDLIVIASHGKTGLLHHLGSVVDKVTRGATCPVYLVRASK